MRVLAALGWALVHASWMIAVLAAGCALLFRAVTSPARRHRAAAIALLLTPPAIVAITAWLLFAWSEAPSWALASAPALSAAPAEAAWRFGAFAPLTATVWIVGLVFALRRPLLAWREARRLRLGAALPVSEQTMRAALDLAANLGVRRPRVACSRLVEVPTVVGIRRPQVLLPAAALGALPESESRGILAHELAHIARRDCLLAALQLAAETLLYFHPAARWLGRVMNAERELACDDLAVAACGSPREYATALAHLEELRHVAPGLPGFALAANGGELLTRVRRLVVPSRAAHPLTAAIACSIAVVIVAGAVPASRLAASAHRDGMGRPRSWRFTGPITISAEDPAGPFTVSLLDGRVTGATMAGRPVPLHHLAQRGDTLRFIDDDGRSSLAVRVKPEGRLSWAPRPARPPIQE